VYQINPEGLIESSFTWRSPEWPGDTEVDVHVVPDGAGTSVLLEHRGWERLSPDGAAIAAQWATGS
jgi:hypothetical protein